MSVCIFVAQFVWEDCPSRSLPWINASCNFHYFYWFVFKALFSALRIVLKKVIFVFWWIHTFGPEECKKEKIIVIRLCKFFSVFLVMRPHWFSPITEKKFVRFPICCVESHDKVCVSAPVPSPPLHDLVESWKVYGSVYLGQSVVEQHFQRTKICKEAQFSEKGEKWKKRLMGVDVMTGLLLIVFIEEDCRALPRRWTVFLLNKLYEKVVSVVRYDGRQIAHGLCELAWGIVHVFAR